MGSLLMLASSFSGAPIGFPLDDRATSVGRTPRRRCKWTILGRVSRSSPVRGHRTRTRSSGLFTTIRNGEVCTRCPVHRIKYWWVTPDIFFALLVGRWCARFSLEDRDFWETVSAAQVSFSGNQSLLDSCS